MKRKVFVFFISRESDHLYEREKNYIEEKMKVGFSIIQPFGGMLSIKNNTACFYCSYPIILPRPIQPLSDSTSPISMFKDLDPSENHMFFILGGANP